MSKTIKYSMKKKEKLFNMYNGKCAYCGKNVVMDYSWNPTSFTIDHFIPQSKGGTNNIENLLPCCRTCNSIKGSRSLEKFRDLMSYRNVNISPLSEEHINFLIQTGYDIDKHIPRYIFYYERVGNE